MTHKERKYKSNNTEKRHRQNKNFVDVSIRNFVVK